MTPAHNLRLRLDRRARSVRWLGLRLRLSGGLIIAGLAAYAALGGSVARAQELYVGRIAVINSEMNFTGPQTILHASSFPATFRFKMNYKLEDNAVAWAYDTSVTVKVERETGPYGSGSWETVLSRTESESRTWPNQKYKREGSIISDPVQQSDPVVRYRVSLTGKSNRTTRGPYSPVITVALRPARGGEELTAILVASRSAAVVYQDFKAAIEQFEDGRPDYSGISRAVENLYRNTLAFWPYADLVLANSPAEFMAAVAEEVSSLLGLEAAVLLVDYAGKAAQLTEQVTADVREAITQANYARAMQPAARELGDQNGHALALDASGRIARALENYGYHQSISAEQLDAQLSGTEADLATFVGSLRRAKSKFETEARIWRFNIGESTVDEVIARGQRFFDVPERVVVGHVYATQMLQRRLRERQSLLAVNALNDRPSPVRVGVRGLDENGRTVVDATLTWGGDDNAYSTESIEMPTNARVLRLTFLNDSYTPPYDPDHDRNAFIDYIELNGVRVEAEDFDRTGGRGGPYSGCGKRREPGASGGYVAGCGNPGDFVEFDLAGLSGG